MGPVSMNWYEEKGFTCIDTLTIDTEFQSKLWNKEIGEEYEVSRITEYYAGGRIDIHHPDSPYGEEYGVSIMKETSWRLLDKWLRDLKTDYLVEFYRLIEMFEKETGHKIEWLEY